MWRVWMFTWDTVVAVALVTPTSPAISRQAGSCTASARYPGVSEAADKFT